MNAAELARRFFRATWHEVYTRARQQTSKRADVFLHRIGVDPFRSGGSDLDRRGRFFADTTDVAPIVEIIKRRMPDEAARIVGAAERILDRRFDLLGYRGLDFGRDVDWSFDPVHGKRVALDPWPTIRFLDFESAGDHRIIWELNRHQFLVTLAKAYRFTANERYADDLKLLWQDWQMKNPYPLGMNWTSALEVALRALAWMWVAFLLEGTSADSPSFQRAMAHALERAGWYIERYLSIYFAPNTHLIGEALALLTLGTRYPGFRHAARWRRRGFAVIEDACRRQVRADGFYFEQATYYHVYALDLFLHGRTLVERSGMPIPSAMDATIRGMSAALVTLGRAGALPRFGDDDGGRVFDGTRNSPHEMLDPLATTAVLYRDAGAKSAVRTFREETLWLLGPSSEAIFDSIDCIESPARSGALRDSGIYTMVCRDPSVSQLFIDAGEQGALTAGHGHADALSVQLASDGKLWLVDSGTYSYAGPDARRSKFRGTAAHNTVSVDGRDQADAAGPFSWGPLPRTEVREWITGEDFDFFEGAHSGYQRLPDPVLHRRFVARVAGGIWLVRDRLVGRGVHDVTIHWHLGPGATVRREGDGVIAFDGDQVLALVPQPSGGWRFAVEMDQYSPVYGECMSAPTLRSYVNAKCPIETATIIASGGATNRTLRSVTDGSAVAYEYSSDDARHFFCFARDGSNGELWKVGGWESDAAFFYFGEWRNGRREIVLARGSYARYGGTGLAEAPARAVRIECRRVAGEWRVSGDPAPPSSFEPSAAPPPFPFP